MHIDKGTFTSMLTATVATSATCDITYIFKKKRHLNADRDCD